MEQFKLKSIDELDLEFVSASRGQSDSLNINSNKSLIPEISKTEPAAPAEETAAVSYFQKPAQPLDEQPVYNPDTSETKKKARPLVPIGQGASYSPVGADSEETLDFSEDDYGEAEVETHNYKGGKGALAGKIISIVLLSVTVVVFILGCFISIFLDNNGSDLGGVCFNTMYQDIESLGVPQNALIISKKLEYNEYASGDLIAVPSSVANRCDIQSVNYANVYSGDAQLTTTALSGGVGYSSSVVASQTYGVVQFFIPALGGLLNFAMDNAILVCVLFVLLSALWCLVLVLLEKSKPATKKEK